MKYITGITVGFVIAFVTVCFIIICNTSLYATLDIDFTGTSSQPLAGIEHVIAASVIYSLPIALLVGILGGVVVSVMIAMLDKMDKR